MKISQKSFKILLVVQFAFFSVIFGLMVMAFPFGGTIFFNSDIGDDINFEFPIGEVILLEGTSYPIYLDLQIGDIFIIFWSVYLVLFGISLLGPDRGFLTALSSIINGKFEFSSNYFVEIAKWFSILILVSVIIDFTQQQLGIFIVPPPIENDLNQFLYVSISPIGEELLFRSLLIGIPLFLFYSKTSSIKNFFKSVWIPSKNLQTINLRKTIFLVLLVGIFFGIAHISMGEGWSMGKFSQATASGIILGWVYVRFGLLVSILVHWATNYFIYSYVSFISQINEITMESAYSHPLIDTITIIFVFSGIISCIVLLFNYFNSKKPLFQLN